MSGSKLVVFPKDQSFTVHLNDLFTGIGNEISKFANNTKLTTPVTNIYCFFQKKEMGRLVTQADKLKMFFLMKTTELNFL